MSRVAVILFNLGGPDSLSAVRPFLFNLFNDPAIISRPRVFRWLIAKLISRHRTPFTQSIYRRVGGRSLVLSETETQAHALEEVLNNVGLEVRVFPAMRYWHPLISEVAQIVEKWRPDRIVLLPLYPQFSSTTTGSSLNEWKRVTTGLRIPTTAICCWPIEASWIATVAEFTRKCLNNIKEETTSYYGEAQLPRVLFSAHGLPRCIVASGDSYQYQVRETVSAIVLALHQPDLDYMICYQSRVGARQWIGPVTRDAIRTAGADGVPVVLVPVTFVSEHIETLVELDIECRRVAESANVPIYVRVPTVRAHPRFIAGLSRLVREALTWQAGDLYSQGKRPHCLLAEHHCSAGVKKI